MKKSLIALTLFSNIANASGLLMQEAVTANAGAAGAGDGVYTESVASAWTNPATMSHMGKQKTSINLMALDLKMDYVDNSNPQGNGDAHTQMPSLGIFHTVQLNEDVHLGLIFGSVGGTIVEYGDEWQGAPYLDKALASAIQFNPSLSFKVTEKVSVGIGAQFNYGFFEVKTSTFETDRDGDFAFGFNAGALYKEDRWAVGLSYRSKLEHEFNVDANTVNRENIQIGTELIFPTIVDVSGSYDITKQFTLLSSVQWHKWSDYANTPIYNDTINSRPYLPQGITRGWDDAWKFAIGADYQITPKWAVKTGFSYETSLQDDPTQQWVDMPVGEQFRYSLGLSTYWDTTRIDLFYEYADLGSVDIQRDVVGIVGAFEGQIHFVGANVTF
ncbi:OmpP1/FadL family transporter [Vibrio comitans]|uniref:Long-chain fatty acid transporter n=1 Tax=Vibrio comitans NBRC 102076 TaxID=1219078 RepID=A0A4Y3IQJ9_9VIBR|nr:outer membrane protein transport protein [Vibrio comitans]GEA61134.1 long-chain fatty acid transporter [Vibrio comitans NBRC 102076]